MKLASPRGMRVNGPEQDLTYRIIGCAMDVHNALGPGLKEMHYHEALSEAFWKAGLRYESEKRLEVALSSSVAGTLFIDHLVEGKVIVEEKALTHPLTNDEIAQVITYLAATRQPVGLLLNFGRRYLEHRRILPPRDLTQWRNRVRRYAWTPRTPHSLIR